jgi:ribonuclease HI
MLTIYTDGASSLKPRRCGGLAFCLVSADDELILLKGSGHFDVTNQQMELLAALQALETSFEYVNRGDTITLISDSEYVVKAVTENRLYVWNEISNWRNSKGDPVANKEMWERMIALRLQYLRAGVILKFQWVRGHNGNKYNELCDKRAVWEKHRILSRINRALKAAI